MSDKTEPPPLFVGKRGGVTHIDIFKSFWYFFTKKIWGHLENICSAEKKLERENHFSAINSILNSQKSVKMADFGPF